MICNDPCRLPVVSLHDLCAEDRALERRPRTLVENDLVRSNAILDCNSSNHRGLGWWKSTDGTGCNENSRAAVLNKADAVECAPRQGWTRDTALPNCRPQDNCCVADSIVTRYPPSRTHFNSFVRKLTFQGLATQTRIGHSKTDVTARLKVEYPLSNSLTGASPLPLRSHSSIVGIRRFVPACPPGAGCEPDPSIYQDLQQEPPCSVSQL
jgi:hypothetical protein